MERTENFIRARVRDEIPKLVDKIKEEVAKQVCVQVLEGLVDASENRKCNYYLQHFLVQDITVIIDQEIAAHLENPPKPQKRRSKIKGAI